MERALKPTSNMPTEITRPLATFASTLTLDHIPDDVAYIAKQCILDWLGVTLAGAQDELTQILYDYVKAEGCGDAATLFGLGGRGSVSQAALINGAAGHALDYDDVLRIMRGHPTAPVAPPVLALSEREKKTGRDAVTAFVAGIETQARVGAFMGESHYAKGWHQTATVGTFGAAAASARLLGLDPATTAMALGIAGTQAAGLKSMFGTMCKPLHAGKAAMNGVMAAELAMRGFTSRPDVLERPQGFAATQSTSIDPEAALEDLGSSYWMPNLLFKYHAACYGTHAGIEAARAIRKHPAFDVGKVEKVDINTAERTMGMCNILNPDTGLEVKFSHRFTTALALAGEETGSLDVYSEDMAHRADLVALRDKIAVTGHDDYGPNVTDITVHQSDGTVIRETRDMAIPNKDVDVQWEKLETKFRALARPLIGAENTDRVVAIVRDLEKQDDLTALADACKTVR
jgi:2-methylcitrate dehydratase PrpD